jgi:hypothetical protein
MRRRLIALVAMILVLGLPRAASADLTAFIGLSPTGDTRSARGFGVGFGLLIIGFEFEYANVIEDEDNLSPGLRTGSGNVLVQTPIEVSGIQLYGTAGGGVFRERLIDQQETHFATNFGGGAKIRLAGPLRLRLDYRLFRLRGSPIHDTYQRIYAGANLTF